MSKNTFFNKLPRIYGFGKYLSLNTYLDLGINPRIYPILLKKKNHLISFEEIKANKKILLDKKLINFVKENIDFIKTIRTYKGIRHLNNLPLRGQRTRTNAKTRKKFRSKTNI